MPTDAFDELLVPDTAPISALDLWGYAHEFLRSATSVQPAPKTAKQILDHDVPDVRQYELDLNWVGPEPCRRRHSRMHLDRHVLVDGVAQCKRVVRVCAAASAEHEAKG